MDWQTAGIALATFFIGLIVGRMLGGRPSAAPERQGRPPIPMMMGTGDHGVRLEAIGPNKLQVIKEVRALTGLGLKDALDLVQAAPSFIALKLDAESAAQAVAALNAAGAKAVTT